MPPRGSPLAVHPWMEATVRALNWLATGEASLAEEPANTMQNSLLQVLVHSLRVLSELEACTFDTVPIETYWRSRSVNGYGEEVHSALSFCWANVEHSLPQRDVAGVLDATEICSGGVRDFIVDPFKYLKPDCARAWMRPPRVMVSTDEWSAVASGLVDRGICDVIPLREVLHVDGKPVLGGLFGVPKMEEVSGIPVLRLIMDLRPINQLFEAIAGDLHTLPMLSQLFPLELFPHENVIVSSEDIKAMFYIVGLPEAWRPLLAFGREVPEILRPAGCSEPCVLTSRVLPMGFVNSVAIAQGLHRNIVNQAVDRFGFSREQEIRKDQSLPAASLAYRVYLDNFDSLYRTNREAADLLAGSLSPLTAGLREIYEELKVPINEKKSVKSALRAEMQGGLIDGVGGIIAPKPDKIARYLRGAWYLLQSKTADLKRVQTVAGGLVYLFSYRRCLMSCLNEIWSFISSFEGKLRVWKTIPPRVKMEIFSSIALCPLAYMDLRCAYDPIVTASDASESGGGLSYSSGLTEFGVQAMSKNIRGLNDSISDDNQVLVISLFDGIGACRVALDLIGAKVAGYVAIEPDAAARRVVECAFGSTEFVTSVTMLRSWRLIKDHVVIRTGALRNGKRDSVRIQTNKAWNPHEGFLVAMKYRHVPYGAGVWPAFWTMCSDYTWPKGGELDILEFANDQPNLMTFHTLGDCAVSSPKLQQCTPPYYALNAFPVCTTVLHSPAYTKILDVSMDKPCSRYCVKGQGTASPLRRHAPPKRSKPQPRQTQ
ncbi:putative endo-1,3(4)-beta-glucanase [Symbiodinium microadriaticum]|uniref:Putative endo-1,3(4)-beta-glucanase n=2 Tax=Symbiodinium TaxID=2949 RepID=A0A1Q9EFI1_SYMMI|nr:putative endo-1,3(4)-beta-glucanase [Symbiodinium microadriaticum]